LTRKKGKRIISIN